MLEKRAIKQSLKKPAPDRISMSGPNALLNDFYSVSLVSTKIDWKIIVLSESEHAFECYSFLGGNNGTNFSLVKSFLPYENMDLKIEHYFRGNVFTYNNAINFLFSQFILKHRFLILWNKILQKKYNRKSLTRVERYELLIIW